MQWQYLNAAGEQISFQDEHLQTLIDAGEINGDTQMWREDLTDWVAARELLDGIDGAPVETASAAPVLSRKPALRTTEPVPIGQGALASAAPSAAPRAGAAAAPPSAAPVAATSGGGEAPVVRRLAGIFSPASGWMKLVSALLIFIGLIYAAIGVIGLVGAIMGGEFLSGIIGGGLFIALAIIPIWMGVLAWKGGGYAVEAAQSGNRESFETSLDSTRKFFTILGVLLLIKLLLIGGLILFGILGGASALLMSGMGMGDMDMGEMDMGSMEEPQSMEPGDVEDLMGVMEEAGIGGAEVEQIQGMMEQMGVGGAEMQEALQQVNPEQVQDMLKGMDLEGLGIEGVDANQIQQVLEALQGGAAAPSE